MRGKILFITISAVLGMGIGAALALLLFPHSHVIPALATVPPFASDVPTEPRSDNEILYAAAVTAARAVFQSDFSTLSSLTHPERGCLFAPFSTVDADRNPVFQPGQILDMGADGAEYAWGVSGQAGPPLSMTPAEFFRDILQIRDFSAAPVVGFDTVLRSGNAVENVIAVYPGCHIVDLYCPGEGKDPAGADWASLKLVFAPCEDTLKLVAIVRSVYTEQ